MRDVNTHMNYACADVDYPLYRVDYKMGVTQWNQKKRKF